MSFEDRGTSCSDRLQQSGEMVMTAHVPLTDTETEGEQKAASETRSVDSVGH